MKNAIITGSEGQLGKYFISRLKKLNYNVVGFDILDKQTSDNQYFKVDISKKNEIHKALENFDDDFDVLINNAGVSVFKPFEDRTEEEIDYVYNVNLKGTILMSQAIFNKFFKKQNYGCIVNIGSIYGDVAGDMRIYNTNDRRTPEIYGATKAAIINLTKYFAAYMAPYNVRVNCISPGGIYNKQNSEFIDKYSKKVPLNKMANVNELGSTLEYLISNESTYTTGQNIFVDGGLTIL